MSTHVEGLVPPDAHFTAMAAVYQACKAAGVDVPDAVERFFNFERPDPKGVRISLNQHAAVSVYDWDSSVGFDVDLSKLPEHIRVLRFRNSW